MQNVPVTTDMHDAEWLLQEIAGGRTLYVRTCTRTTVITPACLKRWQARRLVLLKQGARPAGGGPGKLLMAAGNKFVDISLCRLELTKV